MKQLFGIIAFVLMLVSCGPGNGKFRLEGRLRNLNQGEFYIYSIDGGLAGADTITVRDGRFSYESPVRNACTFVIVFPNYSEQPVFAAPGASLKIKGDATHLKELSITGSKPNEQMTALREQLARLTPPEVLKEVEDFIRKNPENIVSNYLLNKYFVWTNEPNIQLAAELAGIMVKQQPDNARLAEEKKQLDALKNSEKGQLIPTFNATDINGKGVSRAQLRSQVNVIQTYASWNYQSGSILRTLQRLKKEYGQKLSIVTISLDGDVRDCKQRMERDSINWPVICDGKMFQSPVLKQLGIATIPALIVADNSGRIVLRDLKQEKIEEELRRKLK